MKRPFASRPAAWALTLALGMSMGWSVAARNAPEPVAVDADFKPAERAAELLQVLGGERHYQGIQRVAVTQFAVQFITFDSISAETAGGLGANRASVTGRYKLGGVGEPDFQAAAEAFHAQFLRDLQAGGLQVVPMAEVTAAPSWRRMAATGEALPLRSEDAVTVAPPGLALWGVSKASLAQEQARTSAGGLGALGNLSATLSTMGSVTQAIGQVGDNIELQKELGGAALLEVTLRVHFAQLTNHNRGFLGRMSNTAKVTAQVAPAITMGRLTVGRDGASVALLLKQPLVLDAAAMTETRKAPQSGAAVATAIGLTLLRAAVGAGGGASSDSDSFEAVADPAKWRQIVGQGMGLTGQLFVQRLNAVRANP